MRMTIPRAPRLTGTLAATLILVSLVAVLAPQQIGVLVYKGSLICLAGWGGYWLDRDVFPYARPDGYLACTDWRESKSTGDLDANYPVAAGYERVFAAAMLRRAAVMAGAMLGLGMAL